MKLVIIEDRVDDFEYFKTLFVKYYQEHKLIHYENAGEFLKRENLETIDLLILDVELPDISAIDLLKSFRNYKFEILFCTASEAYALDAFRYQSLGYLLKPYAEVEFLKTFKYVFEIINAKKLSGDKVQNKIQYITIPSSSSILFYPMNDVLRLESNNNYTSIYSVHNESCLSSYGIKYFEPQLHDQTFFRCHKSHIINLKYIKKYYLDGTIIMTNGDKIPLARRRRQEFIENYSYTIK